ncbi:MAG: hypothetical protein ACTSU5_00280 [Promethearchaeota archaeon]
MNKQIVWLLVANLLWAAIPLPVADLVDRYSVFTVVLLRFLPSGLLTLGCAFLLVSVHGRLARRGREVPLRVGTVSARHLWAYLGDRNVKFHGIRQWAYLLVVGSVGIASQIVFFFFGLKLAGVVLTMAAVPASIVVVAVYNWGKGREDLDVFKGIYLALLCTVVAIIWYERRDDVPSVEPFGLVSVVLLCVTLATLVLITRMDEKGAEELEVARQAGTFYEVVRLLFKSAVSQLFAAGSVFAMAGLFHMFPPSTVPGEEARRFFADLPRFVGAVLSVPGLFLVLGATFVPYIIWFSASAFWPREALTFGQWSSILGIVEPTGGIVLGVIVLGETFAPMSLAFLLACVVLAVVLRYLHESKNTVNALVLVKFRTGRTSEMIRELLGRHGVRAVRDLLGHFDAIVELQVSSVRAYVDFLVWLRETGALVEVEPLQVAHFFK